VQLRDDARRETERARIQRRQAPTQVERADWLQIERTAAEFDQLLTRLLNAEPLSAQEHEALERHLSAFTAGIERYLEIAQRDGDQARLALLQDLRGYHRRVIAAVRALAARPPRSGGGGGKTRISAPAHHRGGVVVQDAAAVGWAIGSLGGQRGGLDQVTHQADGFVMWHSPDAAAAGDKQPLGGNDGAELLDFLAERGD